MMMLRMMMMSILNFNLDKRDLKKKVRTHKLALVVSCVSKVGHERKRREPGQIRASAAERACSIAPESCCAACCYAQRGVVP